MTNHFVRLHKMVPADFDSLLRRVNGPGHYRPRVAKVLSTSAPWDTGCATAQQTQFLSLITQSGGQAGICRAVADADMILQDPC